MRSRAAVSFIVATSLVAVLASPAGAWTSSKIEDAGSDPDVAFVSGRTAVVYVRREPSPNADTVRYASLVDGVWQRQTVLANSVFFGTANPQVALEPDGTPWVFFDQLFPDASPLYVRVGDQWTFATSIPGGTAQDLKILPDGRVAMLTRPSNQGALDYSTYDPATSTVETTQISDKDVHVASLWIRDGIPRVAFGASDGTVNYAILASTGWTVEQIASVANGSGSRPSLTFSFSGQARVAYVSGTGLMYAYRKSPGVWGRRLVHADATAINPVIRTSQKGPPQIAYTTGSFDSGQFALRWAVWTPSGWPVSTLFPSVGGPHLGGIALVGSLAGTPRIAYNGTVTVRWAQP